MSKQSIRLIVEGDKVKVVTPYHPEFVHRARKLRGDWDGKAWVFDETMLDYVKDLMIKCYGVTGEVPYETCILVVTNYNDSNYGGACELFGRTIAKAWGRDSGAKLGDDIFLINGSIGSGGSVKNWKTVVTDATLEIHDFPLPRTEFEDVKKALQEGWVTIKMPKPKARSIQQIEADLAEAVAKVDALREELKNAQQQ